MRPLLRQSDPLVNSMEIAAHKMLTVAEIMTSGPRRSGREHSD